MVAPQSRVYGAALVLWVLSVLFLLSRNQSESDSGVLLAAALISLGVIVLGVLLQVWNWWTCVKELDPVATLAWSLSLWQLIAWPCMILSGAWMLSDLLASAILGAGLLVGIAYGAWSLRTLSAVHCGPLKTNVASADRTLAGESQIDEVRTDVSALAWFTLGLIGALGVTFFIACVASFLRGPIQGHNEWGTPVYANSQLFVNLGGGFAVLTIGWTAALALRRLNAPRGLAWGIIAGTTPLGLLFASGF